MSQREELMKLVQEMDEYAGRFPAEHGDIQIKEWSSRIREYIAKAAQGEVSPIGKVLSEEKIGIGYDRRMGNVLWFGDKKPGFIYQYHPSPYAQVLVEALERIAAFKPKDPCDGDGYREWNRAGEYAASIAREALNKHRSQPTALPSC